MFSTPFAVPRKGLVMLQLWSCCRGVQLSKIAVDNKTTKHVVM